MLCKYKINLHIQPRYHLNIQVNPVATTRCTTQHRGRRIGSYQSNFCVLMQWKCAYVLVHRQQPHVHQPCWSTSCSSPINTTTRKVVSPWYPHTGWDSIFLCSSAACVTRERVYVATTRVWEGRTVSLLQNGLVVPGGNGLQSRLPHRDNNPGTKGATFSLGSSSRG